VLQDGEQQHLLQLQQPLLTACHRYVCRESHSGQSVKFFLRFLSRNYIPNLTYSANKEKIPVFDQRILQALQFVLGIAFIIRAALDTDTDIKGTVPPKNV
jgi:hypothetical protein